MLISKMHLDPNVCVNIYTNKQYTVTSSRRILVPLRSRNFQQQQICTGRQEKNSVGRAGDVSKQRWRT